MLALVAKTSTSYLARDPQTTRCAMADILYDFPINAAPKRVFDAISRPEGLDQWWTEQASGVPEIGTEYELGFGPPDDWLAVVTKCQSPTVFELEMTKSDTDWNGTRVGFFLTGKEGTTAVRFYHTGWPAENEHFRPSAFCWAMYLRILRRFLEHGEIVPYEKRLDH